MKQGLLPAMVTGLSVADLMIKNPITIHRGDDIEVVARIIHEKKIGGLPVVDDDNKVVGVMTVTDLLNAFINIMGILTNGTRLDVNVGQEPDGFENQCRDCRPYNRQKNPLLPSETVPCGANYQGPSGSWI
jgi:acetoin utilization protein AcuB